MASLAKIRVRHEPKKVERLVETLALVSKDFS